MVRYRRSVASLSPTGRPVSTATGAACFAIGICIAWVISSGLYAMASVAAERAAAVAAASVSAEGGGQERSEFLQEAAAAVATTTALVTEGSGREERSGQDTAGGASIDGLNARREDPGGGSSGAQGSLSAIATALKSALPSLYSDSISQPGRKRQWSAECAAISAEREAQRGRRGASRRILLATVPRSGSHWTRNLVEIATGVATLAVYKERGQWQSEHFAFGRPCGQTNNCSRVHGAGAQATAVVKTHSPFQKFNSKEDFVVECAKAPLACNESALPVVKGLAAPEQHGPIDMVAVIVRNPLDALDSWRRYRRDEVGKQDEWEPVSSFGERWRRHHLYWRSMADSTCTKLLELAPLLQRFEDLYYSPAPTLSKFLQATSLWAQHQLSSSQVSLAIASYPPGPKVPGSSARTTPAAEIEWILENLREELVTYGYLEMMEEALKMAGSASSSSRPASQQPVPLSVILTTHNMGAHIAEVVESIFQTTRSEFELIVVYDGCSDNSREAAEEAVQRFGCPPPPASASASRCMRYIPVATDNVFETLANNAGLQQASGELLALIQDDCVLREYAWDKRIAEVFLSHPGQFAAVSGRCAHNEAIKAEYTTQEAARMAEMYPGMRVLASTNAIGACQSVANGSLLAASERFYAGEEFPRDKIFVRDVAIRPPLVLDGRAARELNFFDPAFAPMEYDDHDFCLRAAAKAAAASPPNSFPGLCGVRLIDFISPDEWSYKRHPEIHVRAEEKPGRQARHGPTGYLPRNGRIVADRHRGTIEALRRRKLGVLPITRTLCNETERWVDC